MALKMLLEQEKTFFTLLVLLGYLSCKVTCETGDCRQQEFRDRSGNCVPCSQCGPGMELSKECGFGYGEDAQCVTCRLHRFKEDWGFQKCKPCLDCALVNRFQKANCSATSDAICGDCLPGVQQKGPHQTPDTGILILDFPVFRTMRNKFLLFINYLVCDILLQQHKTD
uniref:TNF receptor superfamily member 19 n=1 Tax=Macaca nemestrina TaxID=9545 RepID=A0A2K6E5X3_MACNE